VLRSSVAFDAKYHQQSALHRRRAIRFWAHPSGHTSGHAGRVFAPPIQKTERKRGKATAFLTSPQATMSQSAPGGNSMICLAGPQDSSGQSGEHQESR
jgi:hypothetical protein